MKENEILYRVIITLVTVVGICLFSHFEVVRYIAVIGPSIFLLGVLIQYFVVYPTLRKAPVEIRLGLLYMWRWICYIGFIIALLIAPDVYDGVTTGKDMVRWSTVYIAISSLFVAILCTHRAFARYGALG